MTRRTLKAAADTMARAIFIRVWVSAQRRAWPRTTSPEAAVSAVRREPA